MSLHAETAPDRATEATSELAPVGLTVELTQRLTASDHCASCRAALITGSSARMAVAYASCTRPSHCQLRGTATAVQYCFRAYGPAGVLDLAGLAVLLTFLG